MKNYDLISEMNTEFTEQEVTLMLSCDEYNDTLFFSDMNRLDNIMYSEDDVIAA